MTPTMEPNSRVPGRLIATLREGGVALMGIVLVGLIARSIGLGSSYWADEISALIYSFRLPGTDVLTTFVGDNHHPLYSAFARMSLVLFGESPWSVRLPAAVFGVGTVAATYAVARLIMARTEALLASLLLAVSYHHVWFSQNARGYTLIGLLSVLSTWFLLQLFERDSWRLAWAYGICAGLAAYTHLTMVFVAIGQALVALVVWRWPDRGHARADMRKVMGAFALAAVITVALYAPMLTQVMDFFLNKPSQLVSKSTPLWAIGEAVRVLLLGLGGAGTAVAALVLVVAAAIGVIGFAAIFASRRSAALAFSVPPLVIMAGALLGRGTMYPRFFFFAASFAVMILVRGVFTTSVLVQRWLGRPVAPRLALAACLTLVAVSTASLTLNYRFPKQDFSGAMAYVLAAKAPGDVVAFAGIPHPIYRPVYGQDWPSLKSLDELGALRTRGRTWLIYTFPRYLDLVVPGVASVVARECREQAVLRGTVGGGDMIICTFDPV